MGRWAASASASTLQRQPINRGCKFELDRVLHPPCVPELRQSTGAAVGAACHYTISSISIRRGGPGDTTSSCEPASAAGAGASTRLGGLAGVCHMVGRRGDSPPQHLAACRQRRRPAAHGWTDAADPSVPPGRPALASVGFLAGGGARQFNLVMATAVQQQGPCGFDGASAGAPGGSTLWLRQGPLGQGLRLNQALSCWRSVLDSIGRV